MELGFSRDFGYEMRRLLLRRIKDYYQENSKRIIPDNETDIDLLNMICSDEDSAFDYGFIPIFEENGLTQVFYNYKTGESFTAIAFENGYGCYPDTYSTMNSFSSVLALNLGLCLKIFEVEKNKIEDEDLVFTLEKTISKIYETLDTQKKLIK